jgi:ABC-2 type transport system permease protein
VVAGWSFFLPLALMTALTMIVFYILVIGSSQLALALLMRTLQSRRFRDLSIVLLGIFSSSCYLFQQFALRGLGTGHFLSSLRDATIPPYLQWLPPAMAARVIQQAFVGHWGASFAWLGALLAVSVLMLYLWQLVVERGLSAAEEGGAQRVRRRRTAQAVSVSQAGEATRAFSLAGRIRSSRVLAVALKDVKYYRRDPQLLRLVFQSFISIIVLVAVTLFNSGDTGRLVLGAWAIMAAPAYALFTLFSFSYNVLGMERQSLTTLLLFPIEPRQILLGKNIPVFFIGVVEVLLLVFISAFLVGEWDLVPPAIAVGIAGIGIVIACGNYSSVFFPQRMPQARRGFQSSASTVTVEGGCLRSVLGLVVLLVTALVLVPVMLALVLPVIFHLQWIWSVSIPASLLYGAIFYYTVTTLVSPRILSRAPEILAVVTRE